MSELAQRDGDTGTAPGRPGPPAPPAPRPRRVQRRWLVALGTVLVLAGLAVGGSWYAVQDGVTNFDQRVERFPSPFRALPQAERPPVETSARGALNILLLGSDSRVSAGDPTQWNAGAQRTDSIMVVHLPADRKATYVVSIPRDSWVPIPGRGMHKINAAFSFGGPALMIRTVEQLTKLRIDHMALVDFEGFKAITDAVGGVTITVQEDTKDKRAEFSAGTHRMDGETALNYVRQRYNLPGGDFDRVKRQQNWLRALLRELRSAGTLTNPLEMRRMLEALSTSLATDEGFTLDRMQELASSAAETGNVVFFTAPLRGTGRSADGQSIVLLHAKRSPSLWTAVRRDRVRDWVVANRPELLGSSVR